MTDGCRRSPPTGPHGRAWDIAICPAVGLLTLLTRVGREAVTIPVHMSSSPSRDTLARSCFSKNSTPSRICYN